tara:strand:+ start:588 stop:836 length:249 start_codon:yes stop_codon:yes gene_type:complete
LISTWAYTWATADFEEVKRGKKQEASKRKNWPLGEINYGLEGSWSKLKELQLKLQCGGGKEDRTPDLNAASVALSQLSYAPT